MKKLKKTNSTRKTPAIFFVLFISFLFLGFSDPITAHSGDDNYSYPDMMGTITQWVELEWEF